jgi:uncharacterized repeat protein (TIGR01451 family)
MNSSSTVSLRLRTCAGRLILIALVFAGVLASSPLTARAQDPSADIVVSKSGDEAVALGGQITYSLTVYNAGPDEATNVVLTDTLPVHTSFVNASTNTGSVSFDGTTVTVNVGTLAFDTTATATLVVQVDQNTPRASPLPRDSMPPARPQRRTRSTRMEPAIRRSRLLITTMPSSETPAARAGRVRPSDRARPTDCRRTPTTTRLISTSLVPTARTPGPGSVSAQVDRRTCQARYSAMPKCWS